MLSKKSQIQLMTRQILHQPKTKLTRETVAIMAKVRILNLNLIQMEEDFKKIVFYQTIELKFQVKMILTQLNNNKNKTYQLLMVRIKLQLMMEVITLA